MTAVTSVECDCVLATVVEVTGFPPNVKVWFPQKDRPIPIRRTKLMIAYRLHVEEANVAAMEIARSGDLGKLRMFNPVFALQV